MERSGPAAGLILASALVRGTAAEAVEKVVVGVTGPPTALGWPFEIAIEKGFFAAEGVKAGGESVAGDRRIRIGLEFAKIGDDFGGGGRRDAGKGPGGGFHIGIVIAVFRPIV